MIIDKLKNNYLFKVFIATTSDTSTLTTYTPYIAIAGLVTLFGIYMACCFKPHNKATQELKNALNTKDHSYLCR